MRNIAALMLSLWATSLRGEIAFVTPPERALTGTTRAIAVVDLNGDGFREVVIPATWDAGATSGLFVFPNTGTGPDWTSVVRWPSAGGVPTHTHAVADVNRDGVDDIVFISGGPPASPSLSYTVFLGNRSWDIRRSSTYQLPESLSSNPPQLADVTGDGIPDVVALLNGFIYVQIALAGGELSRQSTLSAVPTRSLDSTPLSFAVGDFNDDDVADAAVLNSDPPGAVITGIGHDVTILTGNGTGEFGLASTFDVPRLPLTIDVVRNTGAGPDAIVTTHNVGFTTSAVDSVYVWLPRSPIVVENVGKYAAGSIPRIMQVVDLDGDQLPDIWIRDTNRANPAMYVLRALGRARFAAPTTILTYAPNGVIGGVAADLTGDHLPELVTLGDMASTIDLLIFVNRSRPEPPARRRAVNR
jgi:hypothetical protein